MKKVFIIALVLVFTIALLAFAVQDLKYELGKKVTGLTLKDHDGKDFDLEKVLADENTKGVVFIFISCVCPDSRGYDERYVKYAADFKKNGILLVGINANYNETVEEMSAYAKEKNYNFTILKDWNNIIADRFNATRTPEVFFIDKNSVLRYKGRIDDNTRDASLVKDHTLVNVMGEYLAGKELSVTETRAVG